MAKNSTSDFEKSMSKVIKNIRGIMPQVGFVVITAFQGYVGQEMGLGKGVFPPFDKDEAEQQAAKNARFSSTPGRLKSRTGRLFRSFGLRPDNEADTLSKSSFSGDTLKVTIGSALPYARIQDEGGKIWSRGNMYGFLMRQYYLSGNKMWLYTALSLFQKGYIRIRKTNYFTNAKKKFATTGIKVLEKNFHKMFKKELKKVGL